MILLSIFLACAMADGALRVNDISAVGSHNSYKLPIPPEVMEALRERNARAAEALDYAHRP